MTHDYHEKLPGYHADQVLHDGCGECEARAKLNSHGIAQLDLDRFRHAWRRAAGVGRGHIPLAERSAAEMPMLDALWAVQVQLERVGIPIGEVPAPLSALQTLVDLKHDRDDLQRVLNRLSELLTGTANALKGEPGPLHLHDWSDLPVVAGQLRAEHEALGRYAHALARGLSDAEAREEGWPATPRERTEARVRSGELGVGALIASPVEQRIVDAGTTPEQLAGDLADAAVEDGYDGPVSTDDGDG